MTIEEVLRRGHVVYAYEGVIIVVSDHLMTGYRWSRDDGHWLFWDDWDWTDTIPRSLLSGVPEDDDKPDHE